MLEAATLWKDVWKSASTINGALSAVVLGVLMKLLLLADSWAMLEQVAEVLTMSALHIAVCKVVLTLLCFTWQVHCLLMLATLD